MTWEEWALYGGSLTFAHRMHRERMRRKWDAQNFCSAKSKRKRAAYLAAFEARSQLRDATAPVSAISERPMHPITYKRVMILWRRLEDWEAHQAFIAAHRWPLERDNFNRARPIRLSVAPGGRSEWSARRAPEYCFHSSTVGSPPHRWALTVSERRVGYWQFGPDGKAMRWDAPFTPIEACGRCGSWFDSAVAGTWPHVTRKAFGALYTVAMAELPGEGRLCRPCANHISDLAALQQAGQLHRQISRKLADFKQKELSHDHHH